MCEGDNHGIMLKCMYVSMIVCLHVVAGAYTVMAVAWVVVGMAVPTTLLG
jgi:hypothetical protein